jgi:hypothetical protein
MFLKTHYKLSFSIIYNELKCRNPILRECDYEIHTLEMGTWESIETPETSEFDCKGQNTSHWGVLYIIGKLSKHRCQKWACISHLDIYSTSYDKKKSREKNPTSMRAGGLGILVLNPSVNKYSTSSLILG